MATITRLMTEEEFLALPDDDGVDRMLIRGELVEGPVTTRSLDHSVVNMTVGYYLKAWNKTRPDPRGLVIGGEGRVRLFTDSPSFVGVDVAFIGPESRPSNTHKPTFADGPPLLVVEIISPSDQASEIADKVELYLSAGVPRVWLLDPRFKTVIVYRPDGPPHLFHLGQTLDAEPHLPGFRVTVAEVFEDISD